MSDDRQIRAQPITAEAFAPFGDLIEAAGDPDKIINQGLCGRFHDRATLEFGAGRAGISLFRAKARALPLVLDMVERHPAGSQAFVPMTPDPFLVIVAPDVDGRPGTPLAFVTRSGLAVNYHAGTWHGVLTPLTAPGLFAVVDRIATTEEAPSVNLEEHWFDTPWTVLPPL
ncbi:ureidoglycolate lyase [Chachezhania sediminis]|uniref:ureidoglycolate lyase n=1 Tax=Chachezhania sediminis TaxID=2599291 RepID=UPI00131BF892|nr:ureidoglycolate lyase [Chachezhania sediminis]